MNPTFRNEELKKLHLEIEKKSQQRLKDFSTLLEEAKEEVTYQAETDFSYPPNIMVFVAKVEFLSDAGFAQDLAQYFPEVVTTSRKKNIDNIFSFLGLIVCMSGLGFFLAFGVLQYPSWVWLKSLGEAVVLLLFLGFSFYLCGQKVELLFGNYKDDVSFMRRYLTLNLEYWDQVIENETLGYFPTLQRIIAKLADYKIRTEVSLIIKQRTLACRVKAYPPHSFR